MTEITNARRRAKRLADGHGHRAAEQAISKALPTPGQLMLPIMETLAAQGGRARPSDLYDDVAARVGVSPDVRNQSQVFAGCKRNLWERLVRHARQEALARGHIGAPERGVWELTEGGRNALRNVRRGIIVTVFETEAGMAIGAQVEDAAGILLPGSVDLLFTSPPFPLLTAKE